MLYSASFAVQPLSFIDVSTRLLTVCSELRKLHMTYQRGFPWPPGQVPCYLFGKSECTAFWRLQMSG
jgi:hypothetical protein